MAFAIGFGTAEEIGIPMAITLSMSVRAIMTFPFPITTICFYHRVVLLFPSMKVKA
jgi:hypothetical protein